MSYMSENPVERMFSLVEASNAPKKYRTIEINGHSFTFPASALHWPVDVCILMESGQVLAAVRKLLGDQWTNAGVDDWSAADGYRLITMMMDSFR